MLYLLPINCKQIFIISNAKNADLTSQHPKALSDEAVSRDGTVTPSRSTP
jgi:hypothetical protein